MPTGGKLRIYDDGRCEFCQAMQAFMERRDRDHCLDFRDYTIPAQAAEAPFPFDELNRRMYVQTSNGAWHSGFDAWLQILAVLPRWKWLARPLGWAPFRWMGRVIYQFIADHRYRVPHWILRWIGLPQPCDSSCPLPQSPRR